MAAISAICYAAAIGDADAAMLLLARPHYFAVIFSPFFLPVCHADGYSLLRRPPACFSAATLFACPPATPLAFAFHAMLFILMIARHAPPPARDYIDTFSCRH